MQPGEAAADFPILVSPDLLGQFDLLFVRPAITQPIEETSLVSGDG